MTNQPTEKCSTCGQTITSPTDDVKKQDYKEFQETGYCKKCREKPERKDFFEKLTNPLPEPKINVTFILNEILPLPFDYDINEEHPFNANELANTIIDRDEYDIITDKTSEIIYFYTKKFGHYRKDGEQILRTLIDQALKTKSSTNKINETIALIKIKTNATINPSKEIAVLNGILDLKTGTLQPFSKGNIITNQLNVEYQKGAKSENWLHFVEQILPSQEDQLQLQEWSGYALIKGYPKHVFMWLYGPKGRNGKGTWARTIMDILGSENYSNTPIDDLDGKNRFATYSLKHSLVNFSSEPRTNRTLTIELIQSLTGEDPIEAERKGVQERFKMKNEAKLTIMGNSFPRIHNPTDAFWERILILTFPNQFTGSNQKTQIEKIWLENSEDRSGILNWMIDGAKRLIENNFIFTESKSRKEIIIQFKRASDNIGAFIEEAITLDLKAVTLKTDVQKHYTDYCNFIEAQAQSPAKLNVKLSSLQGVKETKARTGPEKIQVRVWKGLSLKPLPEESEEVSENDAPQKILSDFGTGGTDVTGFSTNRIFEEVNNNIDKIPVPPVPAVPLSHDSSFSERSEVFERYTGQLVCVFCEKDAGDDWVQDDFTWDKHAHRSCYEAKRSELANLDKPGDA
jgi:P4 family phage/plasmid primase-like protien